MWLRKNAICESVYSPWTQGSKKQIQYSSQIWKTTIFEKKTLMPQCLSWESVISSASQSSQIHNITAPPEEMLFRCLERRLDLNLMLGPGLPQKASTFETMHFHRPLSCGQRCVDVNNIIKICWEGNQQLLKGCKNHFHGYWKHVRNMSFFCLCIFFLTVSLKRSWLTRRPVYVCVSSLDAERLPSSACQRSSCETQNLWLGVNGLKQHQAAAVLKHLVAQAFHVAFEQSKSSTRRKDPAVVNQAPNANSQQLKHAFKSHWHWVSFLWVLSDSSQPSLPCAKTSRKIGVQLGWFLLYS